jgi:hypothetical protein
MRRHKLKLRPQKSSPLHQYKGDAETALRGTGIPPLSHHQPSHISPDARSGIHETQQDPRSSQSRFQSHTPDFEIAAPPAFDPSLDPTIKDLFKQQAEIQAKLAALLPAQCPPDSRLELDMLHHKLRALEAFAASQRKSKITPISFSNITSWYRADGVKLPQNFLGLSPYYLMLKKRGHCNISASALRAILLIKVRRSTYDLFPLLAY